MSNINNSLYNLRLLDDLAERDTFIHRIHPTIKLLTTIAYLITVISFERYELSNLIVFVFYPVIIFALADIPTAPLLKRMLLIEPLIIGIGILNPILDHQMIMIGQISMSRGWITLFSIIIKSALTVTAALLLVATTGMDRLGRALRMLGIPKILVMQLLLTYRYITVMMEEIGRILRAYSLRAPGQKGINKNAWGPLAGQLILRTFERAQRIYQAMRLRGYSGEYNTGDKIKISIWDLLYLVLWCLFFIIARIYNIPLIMESLLTGVIK